MAPEASHNGIFQAVLGNKVYSLSAKLTESLHMNQPLEIFGLRGAKATLNSSHRTALQWVHGMRMISISRFEKFLNTMAKFCLQQRMELLDTTRLRISGYRCGMKVTVYQTTLGTGFTNCGQMVPILSLVEEMSAASANSEPARFHTGTEPSGINTA